MYTRVPDQTTLHCTLHAMAAVNLLLASLCVLCFGARGYGQVTNLTLFQITPCSGVKVDTVSRFKSDIYAVVADLRNCTNVSLAEDFKIVSGWRARL